MSAFIVIFMFAGLVAAIVGADIPLAFSALFPLVALLIGWILKGWV